MGSRKESDSSDFVQFGLVLALLFDKNSQIWLLPNWNSCDKQNPETKGIMLV